jgi:hypothetical protein
MIKRGEHREQTRQLKTVRLSFSQDILNKRYDLYTWMNGWMEKPGYR